MTGVYEAKGYYQEEDAALAYESQYRSSLALRNLRAKLVGWGEEKAFARLLNRVPKRGRVLDIACGTERYMETMLRRGYQVGGVDISSEMLAFAKRRVRHHPNSLFLQRADAERLPSKETPFDVITCMRLYHRVPPLPRPQMLQEVKRPAHAILELLHNEPLRRQLVANCDAAFRRFNDRAALDNLFNELVEVSDK